MPQLPKSSDPLDNLQPAANTESAANTQIIKAMEASANAPSTPVDDESEPQEQRILSPQAQRALAEAAERRAAREAEAQPKPNEIGGRIGPDPVRYGDWESGGIAWDF
jgi:hypothetical protein